MNLPGSTRLVATKPGSGRTRIARRLAVASLLVLVVWNAAGEDGALKTSGTTPATPAAAPTQTATSAPLATDSSVAATQAALQRRLSREKEAMAQERLKPSTPEKLIERHGFIGSLFAKPSRVNPLQLVNPMAQKEYGGAGEPAGAWSWNSMLAPGQAPLPRGFEDPVRHEATAVVVGGSFR